jgi:hypothetical protein
MKAMHFTLFHILPLLLMGALMSCHSSSGGAIDSAATGPKADSQKEVNLLLLEKIKKADTLLLVSHAGTNFDKLKRKEIYPELISRKKINRKIIYEQKAIAGAEIDSLCKILSMPVNDSDIVIAKCFDPHHAIYIISKTEISYIELCFHCWSLDRSGDLSQIKGYDEEKWEAIYRFFKQQGFQYEMSGIKL